MRASSAAIGNRKFDLSILMKKRKKKAVCLVDEEFDTKRFSLVSTIIVILQEMALAFFMFFNQLGNYAVAGV